MYDLLCYDIPHCGASRGGCNENAFCNATQVFMQSPTGNKMLENPLGAGGHQRSSSLCRPSFLPRRRKYLGYYHNQSRVEYVARRFPDRGRNTVGLQGTRLQVKITISTQDSSSELEDFRDYIMDSSVGSVRPKLDII